MNEEMIKFRDFRGQMAAEEFKPTVLTEDLSKLVDKGDPHVKVYNLPVGDGFIKIAYIYEPFLKLVGKYYAMKTPFISFEEYLVMARGF